MEKKEEEYLTPKPRDGQDDQVTDANDDDASHDAVFGELTGEGINYRSVCIPVASK